MAKKRSIQAKIQEEQILCTDTYPQNNNTDIENPRMSEREFAIYNGLKSFRPEIAIYYRDGLLLKESRIQSKSNLLAHLLREIDGGLRDVFEDSSKKKILQKTITKEFTETLFEEYKVDYQNFIYLSKVTATDIKDYSAHISSIAASFELSMDSPLIKEYIKVAVWFHKYAHRSDDNTHAPRDPHDILLIWSKFEDILLQLLTHYHIYDRIDSLLSHQRPTELIIKQLPNILQEEYLKRYFWGKLLHLGWLEPLYNEGYFAGANNPIPVFNESTKKYKVPDWFELFYIQNAAYQMSQNAGADFSIILNIIDDIRSYRNPEGKRIANPNTDGVIIFLISILPSQNIERKHFEYITTIIKSENGSHYSHDFQKRFIDRFIAANDKRNLLLCLPVVLLYRKSKGRFGAYQSLLDRYFLFEFINDKEEDIIRICGIEGFKVIERILKKVEKDHWYSINTIEDHYQNGQDLDDFSHQIVRFVREYLLKLPCDDKLIEIISEYLRKDRVTIYPRIAYYVINSRYEQLCHLFWSVDFNPLKNISNDHELFELLDNHSSAFSKEQINRVLAWIEEVDDYFELEEKKHPSQSKKMWLTALMKTEDASVISAYEKAKEIYPHKIEHPGFSSWMESVIGHASPLDYDSVKEMNLSKIIEYYSNYEEKPLNQHSITDPSIEGLRDIIKYDIKNNISKYTLDIEDIATAPIGFQYSWIIGIWQYCYENKTLIDSDNVLSLIYHIINSQNFKKDYMDNESPRNNKLFTHRVLSVLNCGLDCHGNMFSAEHLPIVKKIILAIYNNDNNVEKIEDRDITSKFINSYSGELYDALIKYNVVAACKSEAPIDARWDSDIRQALDEELSKRQTNPLFYYALGKGYYSLFWIDRSWLGKILSINDNDNWIGFMVGFHTYYNCVTQVFEDFCNSKQYDKFFANRELFDSVMQKKVIQYMCVAYHDDKINFTLDSPLLVKILNEKNASDYENIIQSFNIDDKHIPIEKIKNLWRYMYELNKGLNNEVSKYFIGESYRWLGFFDDIDDEIKKWMLLSVANLQPFAASQVIRKLDGFTKKNPTQVGELLFALVSSESKIPIQSELEKIVEELFESENTEVAKQISNECLRKGYLGLREIVRKYD